jgi:hypothetical protein
VAFWIVSGHGAVAQLGERLNGIQEVEGSTPFSSTYLKARSARVSGVPCGAKTCASPEIQGLQQLPHRASSLSFREGDEMKGRVLLPDS